MKDSLNKQTLDESQAETVLMGLSKWVQFFADQSYMKNMGDFLASAKGDLEGPARYLAGYPQQLIPFRALMGWVTRIIDPNQRKVDPDGGILTKQLQQIATQIPFVSETVPPRLGPDGQPITTSLFDRVRNAVSPAKMSSVNPEMEQIYGNTQEAAQIRKDTTIVKDQDKKNMMPVYEHVQSLKNNGNIDEAKNIVKGLSDEEYKIYTSIKNSRENTEGTFLQKKMYQTVKDVQEMVKQGREAEAKQIIDAMTEEEYSAYKKAKKALTPVKKSAVPQQGTLAKATSFLQQALTPQQAYASDTQRGTSWEDFKSTARTLAEQEGFPIGVLLAQAGLETGRGSSSNARNKNNWFGLGAYDKNPSNAFQFSGAEESIRYYINLIKTDPRYAKAWAVRDNPTRMIQEIKKAGYASDPNYVGKITSMPEFREVTQPKAQTPQQPQPLFAEPVRKKQSLQEFLQSLVLAFQ